MKKKTIRRMVIVGYIIPMVIRTAVREYRLVKG